MSLNWNFRIQKYYFVSGNFVHIFECIYFFLARGKSFAQNLFIASSKNIFGGSAKNIFGGYQKKCFPVQNIFLLMLPQKIFFVVTSVFQKMFFDSWQKMFLDSRKLFLVIWQKNIFGAFLQKNVLTVFGNSVRVGEIFETYFFTFLDSCWHFFTFLASKRSSRVASDKQINVNKH